MSAMKATPAVLDTIDRRILRALQADGRISNLKLAEEVHLSPTAVLERVKRLTRDGVRRASAPSAWAPACSCSSRSCSTAR
jgi:predicted ArsR family transcriptional regulator